MTLLRGYSKASPGFTLAELLIALAILGVIATFTIPKILVSQQNGQYLAVAKEDIAAVSGAYQAYKLNNTASGANGMPDFTPYLNFVKQVSTISIDDNPNDAASIDCTDNNFVCLKMHNGSILMFHLYETFGGTAATNAVFFQVDPNGQLDVNSTADGPGKGLGLRLFYNGRLATEAEIPATTEDGWGPAGPTANGDPAWFSW